MKNKFAIRLKATGEFLSVKMGQGRQFGHIDDAQLWNKIGSAKLAVYHIPAVKEWMKKAKMNSPYYKHSTFPIEIVEFNVVLIDAKKGYIG